MTTWKILFVAPVLLLVGCGSVGDTKTAAPESPPKVEPSEQSEDLPSAEIRATYDQQFCIPFTGATETIEFLGSGDFTNRSINVVPAKAQWAADSLSQGADRFEEWGDPLAEPVAQLIDDLEAVAESAQLTLDGKNGAEWPDLEASLAAVLEVRDPCGEELAA